MGSASAAKRQFRVHGGRARRCAPAVSLLLPAAAALALCAPARAETPVPSEAPGDPILVVADPADPFGRYYGEILRAEGLNAFTVTSTAAVSAESLAGHQVAILAGRAPLSPALSDAEVGALTQWVDDGGNLIAMRPGAELAPLLGLGADTGDLGEGYLKIDTGASPGAGLTGATLQFHGTADRWSPAGATSVATLYADAGAPTSSPAVTLRSVGTAGGQAAAFTYDLARSVVYTRQGNPKWAGQKREPTAESIRSADLFYGAKAGDVQPDWVDFRNIAIPQADEQQRLLANLITTMNLDRTPLPRFWYLPRGAKAAVVMTGDDHANSGTDDQFDAFQLKSPAGCSVVLWQCVRSTSYIYAGTALSDAAASAYEAKGFEVAMHLGMACQDFTPGSLETAWQQNLATWISQWPSVTRPRTHRMHCVTWSDWDSMPNAELRHGVRLDTNYYYAPETFVQDRPGMFTGSGFPMRFADEHGAIIDVYQATTQLTDEMKSDPMKIDYAKHITALLDGALGPNGFYGVFTANMHTDAVDHRGANTIVAAARARGVPVVSAVQMLDWLDGRNGSSFQDLSFDAGRLRFRIAPAPGALGLEAMLPAHAPGGVLIGLTADGVPVSTAPRTVKGVEYFVFDAADAEYVATYGDPPDPPAPPARPDPPAPLAPSAPPSDGAVPGDGGQTTQTIRPTRRGTVKVPVTCRRSTQRCRITVRLRHNRRAIARKTVPVRAGKRVRVSLRLPTATSQALAQRGSLRLTAVITGAGTPRTTQQLRVRALAG